MCRYTAGKNWIQLSLFFVVFSVSIVPEVWIIFGVVWWDQRVYGSQWWRHFILGNQYNHGDPAGRCVAVLNANNEWRVTGSNKCLCTCPVWTKYQYEVSMSSPQCSGKCHIKVSCWRLNLGREEHKNSGGASWPGGLMFACVTKTMCLQS